MKTVTREDLAVAVYEVLGLAMDDSIRVTGALFEVMADALREKQTVHVSGFGKFVPHLKPGFPGVTPTGDPSWHTEHWTVKWKRSDILLERMNAETSAIPTVVKPKMKLPVQPRQRASLDRRIRLDDDV